TRKAGTAENHFFSFLRGSGSIFEIMFEKFIFLFKCAGIGKEIDAVLLRLFKIVEYWIIYVWDMYFCRVGLPGCGYPYIQIVAFFIVHGKIRNIDIKIQLVQLFVNHLNDLSQFVTFLHSHRTAANALKSGFYLCLPGLRLGSLQVEETGVGLVKNRGKSS